MKITIADIGLGAIKHLIAQAENKIGITGTYEEIEPHARGLINGISELEVNVHPIAISLGKLLFKIGEHRIRNLENVANEENRVRGLLK